MGIVILIYIASIVENLKMLLLIIAGIFSVLAFHASVTFIDITSSIEVDNDKSIKAIKRFAICAATVGFFAAIIPSERQVYYISAAYVGINVAENITTSPEFNKIRLIINNKIDEYIKENNIKDAEIAQ